MRRGGLVVEKAQPDGTMRPLAHLQCSPDASAIGAGQREAFLRYYPAEALAALS